MAHKVNDNIKETIEAWTISFMRVKREPSIMFQIVLAFFSPSTGKMITIIRREIHKKKELIMLSLWFIAIVFC